MGHVFLRIYHELDSRERIELILWALIKLFLTILDILGLMALSVLFDKLQPTPRGTLIPFIDQIILQMSAFQIAAISLAFFVSKIFLSVLNNFGIAKFVERVEVRRSIAGFNFLLNSKMEETDSIGEKSLIHGLLGAVHNAFGASMLSFFIILGEISQIIFLSLFLATQNFILFAMISAVFLLVASISNYQIGKKISGDARLGDDLTIKVSTFISEVLRNKRQIVSLGSTGSFRDKFAPLRHDLATANNRLIVFTTLPRYALEITMLLGLIMLSVPLVSTGFFTVAQGTIAVFGMGLFRIVGSMLPLQNQINLLKRIKEEASSAFDLLSRVNNAEIKKSGDHEPNLDLSSNFQESSQAFIEFRNVSYSYPGSSREVFQNLNFKIRQGEFVALVGDSGSGKSTILDLLLGLRQPSTGDVLIDNSSVTRSAGKIIGFVPQRVHLFTGSLSSNISMHFDDSLVDLDRLRAAIRRADLEDLVAALPDGMNTNLDDSGKGLSGGEIQRVGIARALYAKADILVFDESTSSLDAKSESEISSTISSLKGRVTLVVVAHREKTISQADRRLALINGKIHSLK